MLYGGIEVGGTKIICAVGTGPADVQAESRFPTTTPGEALAKIIAFFEQYSLAAIGIGSFGPISLNRGFGAAERAVRPQSLNIGRRRFMSTRCCRLPV